MQFKREDDNLPGLQAYNAQYVDDTEQYILTPAEQTVRGRTPFSTTGTSSIVANLRTQHHWGFSRVAQLFYRDSFLSDGSRPNRAMLAATDPYGPMEHEWRGPVVAVGMTGNEEDGATHYCDIDLGQLRMIIDYAVWYSGGASAKVDRELVSRT